MTSNMYWCFINNYPRKYFSPDLDKFLSETIWYCLAKVDETEENII